jgi:hypothetical protein
MPKRLLALGCLALQLVAGCGGDAPSAKSPAAEAAPVSADAPAREEVAFERGGGKKEDERLAMVAPPPPPPPPGSPAPKSAPSTPPATPGGGEAAAVRAPMLIYTAQISMAVFEVNASLAKVEQIGRELGGFLAKRDDRSITIRVPAAAFDEAVKRVEGVGDMLHRNVAAEDVTEEFRDLEIRLKSARSVQARLTELLAKAVKVEESIAIERELDRVSGEIERIEGRIKYLRDRAAFSTITVRFEPKPTEQVGAGKVRLPVPWLYDINLPRLLRL